MCATEFHCVLQELPGEPLWRSLLTEALLFEQYSPTLPTLLGCSRLQEGLGTTSPDGLLFVTVLSQGLLPGQNST